VTSESVQRKKDLLAFVGKCGRASFAEIYGYLSSRRKLSKQFCHMLLREMKELNQLVFDEKERVWSLAAAPPPAVPQFDSSANRRAYMKHIDQLLNGPVHKELLKEGLMEGHYPPFRQCIPREMLEHQVAWLFGRKPDLFYAEWILPGGVHKYGEMFMAHMRSGYHAEIWAPAEKLRVKYGPKLPVDYLLNSLIEKDEESGAGAIFGVPIRRDYVRIHPT